MNHDVQVAVIGAGPAGCIAAWRLAELGVEVALLDENPGPRPHVICSGIVGAEAFERLGFPQEPILSTVNVAEFVAPGGAHLRYAPEQPLAYVVDRTRFDGALAQRAVRAGANLRRDHRVAEVSVLADGVKLTVAHDGEQRPLTSEAVILAAGYKNRLNRHTGLGAAPEWLQGIHAEVKMEGLDAVEVHFGQTFASGFFGWVVPIGSDWARIGLLTRRKGLAQFHRLLEDDRIRSRLRESPDEILSAGMDEADDAGDQKSRPKILARAIVQGPVRPSFADRVLAVGESAGQIKTTTGGGIYYGMRSAELAAEVLAGALNADRPSAQALEKYEHEWLGLIGKELEMGLKLQELGAEMDDEEIDEVFSIMKGDGLFPAMSRVVRFDWHRKALRLFFAHPEFRRLSLDLLRSRGRLGARRGM